MKQIDKIKKERYKQSRLEGNSIPKSLLNAKYAETTAYHKQSSLRLVKVVEEEIQEEFKASELKPEDVINRIEYLESLAVAKKDISTAVRCEELKGNFLKMFSQNNNSKSPSQTVIIDTTGRFSHLNNVTDEKRDSINVLPDESKSNG